MKRFKTEVFITFISLFVIGVIIYGLLNLFCNNSNFFTINTFVFGLIGSLWYLILLYADTRTKFQFILLGTLIMLLLIIVVFSATFFDLIPTLDRTSLNPFKGWTIRETCSCIYYTVSSLISKYHSTKYFNLKKKNKF